MESRTVSYTLDVPDPVSEPELEAFKRVSSLPDEDIEADDIPEITPERWKLAFPGMLRRFVRTHLMTKADADVIQWLRAKQDGGEELVNALLRREMDKEKAKEKHAA